VKHGQVQSKPTVSLNFLFISDFESMFSASPPSQHTLQLLLMAMAKLLLFLTIFRLINSFGGNVSYLDASNMMIFQLIYSTSRHGDMASETRLDKASHPREGDMSKPGIRAVTRGMRPSLIRRFPEPYTAHFIFLLFCTRSHCC
jgi:hypothetical protein